MMTSEQDSTEDGSWAILDPAPEATATAPISMYYTCKVNESDVPSVTVRSSGKRMIPMNSMLMSQVWACVVNTAMQMHVS
jgi:hypothetical protein